MLARLLAALLLLAPAARAVTIVFEAEQLELSGGWDRDTTKSDAVRGFITAGPHAKNSPAVGAITVPHAGQWRLWVRSKDFPQDRPGTRRFSVRLGAQRAATLFGAHGQPGLEGWAWEDGGTLQLAAGPTLIAIGEENTHAARCDSLVLTDNPSYRPEGVPWQLHKTRAETIPLQLEPSSMRGFTPEPLATTEESPAATLAGDQLRLTWHRARTTSGQAVLTLRAATRKGDRPWQPLPAVVGDSYRVLWRPAGSDPKLLAWKPYPQWDIAFAPRLEVTAGGQRVSTRFGTATAPWASGKCLALRPTRATPVDARTVRLEFPATPAGQLTATWRLEPGQPTARVEFHFLPAADAHVSLGYHAPFTTPQLEADFLLLPFPYHGRRFPAQPNLILSALTPTPLSLVSRGGVTCAVVGEPAELSPAWPGETNSRYGFGLRNEFGQAQPLLYSPVLGQPGSQATAGQPVTARFRVLLQRGAWYAAYRHVADRIYGLRDYREPTEVSLSDTALNLLDLMRNEEAAGWNARAKGPWNIESRNTVTQAAPLTYLSFYLLTGDRDFYRRFARPSLEFMLSRPMAHFAAEREISDNYYTHQPLQGPSRFFGASLWASAFRLTHGRTPAFGALTLTEKGEPRRTPIHGHFQPWEDALALYRLTREPRWLEAARAGADSYMAQNLALATPGGPAGDTALPTKDLGPEPFINVSHVPNWEGLLHLAEETGEPRYRAAAQEAARWLLTTLWVQPLTPAGPRPIHPGGVYDVNRHLWWWGNGILRRGVFEGPAETYGQKTPPVKLPERQVPAWQVSQVGLGLEQPFTYTRRAPHTHANILMSTWAPNLLRLAARTGAPEFRTAARNAFIGRFGSYPGYYLDGPTTEYHRADYPLRGPDVTTLYVHHIPPFAAAVVDYLYSEAEVRTGGAVSFPWVRGSGYVWFDSRLYGHAPGTVYGQKAWPWLHRTAARVNNPKVDCVLAEGDGRLHVILLNQARSEQHFRLQFDEAVLGRSLAGASVARRLTRDHSQPYPLQAGGLELSLAAGATTVLTLEGVQLDIPTHRGEPPAALAIPSSSGQQRQPLPGTQLEATATELSVPPFAWRDLYVSLNASIHEPIQAARLRYTVAGGPEQTLEDHDFPWEFTAELPPEGAVTWKVELQRPGRAWK